MSEVCSHWSRRSLRRIAYNAGMATGKRPPSGIPGSRRKRPAPTIDLKATELAVEAAASPVAPEPAAASAPPVPPQEPPHDPPQDPPHEPPHAASAPPPSGGVAWLPPEFPWPAAVAGALGAAAVLTLVLTVWLMLPRSDATAALSPRLASIETQLRDIGARPAPAAIDPKAIDALTQRLAKLETALAAPRPPVAADPALANRIAALENAFKPVPDALTALARRADQIDAGLREIRGRIDTMAATMATTISETQSAARVASGDHGEIVKLTERIAGLEKSNSALAEQLSKNAAIANSDRVARLALAAAALRAAVERGEPLAAELAAVKPLVSEPASIAPIEPFAASGVPSTAALGRELLQLLPVMRRAAGSVTRDGGLLDRLQANAERLVRIRPIEEVPGEDTNAVLSRIEVKAAHADIGGVLAELAKLQPSVRAPALAWIARAEARNKAVEASRRLAADAVAALKPTP